MRLALNRCARQSPAAARRHASPALVVAGVLCALVAAPAALAAQELARDDRSARVRGVVFDSIAGAPIAGVVIHFVGASEDLTGREFTARTDENGRYAIDALPAGRYIAGFFHRAIDTLGIEMPPRVVELESGDQRVPLATPSMSTLIATICPPEQRSDSTGALIGHVLASDVELAVQDAAVVVEWSEMVIDTGGFRMRDVQMAGGSRGPGWFAICDLPTDVVLYAQAIFGADSSGYVEVELPPGGLRHLTMQVGSGRTVQAAGDTSGTTLTIGTAQLTGSVVDDRGQPMAGAHVVAWGTNRETITGSDGTFRIEGLPGGTRTVEARAVGWVPVRTTVHLSEARVATTSFTFREKAVLLPRVETRELVYSRKLVEFERRRRSGFGTFLTQQYLESRPHVKLGELLREQPGVRVVPGSTSRSGPKTSVLMPMLGGGGTVSCVPTMWIDGVRDTSGDFDLLYSDAILGVEIYPRAFDRPAQFTDSSKCGAIVIWLKPYTKDPKR